MAILQVCTEKSCVDKKYYFARKQSVLPDRTDCSGKNSVLLLSEKRLPNRFFVVSDASRFVCSFDTTHDMN